MPAMQYLTSFSQMKERCYPHLASEETEVLGRGWWEANWLVQGYSSQKYQNRDLSMSYEAHGLDPGSGHEEEEFVNVKNCSWAFGEY